MKRKWYAVNRTPWFSGDVKPVRDGVYERATSLSGVVFARFERGHWYAYSRSPELARNTRSRSLHSNLRWRGLTKSA